MKIEQVLHGYSNGHTPLQSSIKTLSSNDLALMDILSDWSGYQDERGDESYITAYPLNDCDYYVIAKSWYADDMERPGCVWTHSLLINLNDIDKEFDFRMLLPYFKRPMKNDYGAYALTIEINHFPSAKQQRAYLPIDEASLLFLYSSLFVPDKPSVFKVEMEPINNQRFCLSLLQYLPLDLLRKISLSSGGIGLRQIEGKNMTLQFVQDSNSMSLLTPPWQGKINLEQFSEGLRFLLQEILDGRNSIGVIIRIFSKDLGESYLKLCALGELLLLLNQELNKNIHVDYGKVLDILTSAFPGEEGLLVKSNYLGDDIIHLFGSDADFLYNVSVCKDEESLPIGLVQLDIRLEKVRTAHEEIGLLVRIAEQGHYNLFGKEILAKIYASISWTKLGKEDFGKLLHILEDHYQNDWTPEVSWKKLWIECIRRSVDVKLEFADTIRTKNIQLGRVVFLCLNDSIPTPLNITKSSFSDIDSLLNWLIDREDVSELIVSYLFLYVNPNDAYIQKRGAEPWLWIFGYSGEKTLDFYAFVFSLSFNWNNETALNMLRLSFYPIHDILANNRSLASTLWSKVMKYADELPIYEDWDKCKKLRKGLVRYIKLCGYEKSILKQFTPSEKLNKSLLSLW